MLWYGGLGWYFYEIEQLLQTKKKRAKITICVQFTGTRNRFCMMTILTRLNNGKLDAGTSELHPLCQWLILLSINRNSGARNGFLN